MTALAWPVPGPGPWELDDLHKPTTYTRPFLDLAVPAMGDGFAAIGERYGLPFQRLDVSEVHGYLYARMVITGAPAPGDGRATVPPRAVLRILSRAHPALRRRAKAARAAIADRRWCREAEAWFDRERPVQLAANLRLQARIAVGDADAASLAALVQDTAENLRMGAARHFRLIGVQLGVARLQSFLEDQGVAASEVVGLLAGASPATSSTHAAISRARAAVEAAGATGPWADLEALREDAPLAADVVAEHLATHGHRLVGTSDLDGATLIEHPELLLGAIAAPRHPQVPLAPAAASVDAVRAQVPAALHHELDRRLADARACFGVREDEVGIDMSWSGGLLRHAVLAAGRRLVAEGRLARPSDVFELRVQEIVSLLGGASAPTLDEIAGRRDERRAADLATPPPWLGSPPVVPPPADVFPPAMADLLHAFATLRRHLDVDQTTVVAGRGIGIAGQRHVGRARVALEADGLLDALEPGDVLVTGITTPAFNAVLPLLGALVTERGGLLSHPAIAARELDLPAVIGVPGVLATIADGDTVLVDPVAGTVSVVARHRPEPSRLQA